MVSDVSAHNGLSPWAEPPVYEAGASGLRGLKRLTNSNWEMGSMDQLSTGCVKFW